MIKITVVSAGRICSFTYLVLVLLILFSERALVAQDQEHEVFPGDLPDSLVDAEDTGSRDIDPTDTELTQSVDIPQIPEGEGLIDTSDTSFPLLMDLEAEYAATHPRYQRMNLATAWRNLREQTPDHRGGRLSWLQDRKLEESLGEHFDQLSELQGGMQEMMLAEEAERARKIEEGLVEAEYSDETDASGRPQITDVHFKVFEDFTELDPDELVRQVAKLKATGLFDDSALVRLFDRSTSERIQRAMADLMAISSHLIVNRPSERKYKGITDMTPDEVLRFMMDRKKLQFPVNANDRQFTLPDDLVMSEKGVKARFTGVGDALAMRLTLPEFDEEVLLIDEDFVARHGQHTLMLLTRILLRSEDRHGKESGRPVLVLVQPQRDNVAGETNERLRAFYVEQPKKMTAQYMDNYWTAAYTPRTRDDKFFCAVYTFNVVTLGYAVLHWKLSQAAAPAGDYFGPLVNIPQLGELLTMSGTLGLATGMLVFAAWNIAPMASHIAYSSVIGMFHSVYRFIIYHGSKFWQGAKHLVLISYPAAFFTVLFTEGPGAVNPFTLVGLAGLGHILINSVWTNFARPILYSAPIGRQEHRLNVKRYKLPWYLGGFSVKQQQIEAEFFGYAILFTLKFAHLVKLQAYGLPIGEIGYYALPFVAFVVSYAYLKWNNDRVDYNKEIEALWGAFAAPIRLLIFKPLGLAFNQVAKYLNNRMRTKGSLDPHPAVVNTQKTVNAFRSLGRSVARVWQRTTDAGFSAARVATKEWFGLRTITRPLGVALNGPYDGRPTDCRQDLEQASRPQHHYPWW